MLDLTYENKIHLDKWDIDVKPYLTLQEIEGITKQLVTKHTGLERDMCLLANILVACTDIYDSNKDAQYTYEEILYSGFWGDLLSACPILVENIKTINQMIDEFFSINKKIYQLLDTLESKCTKLDIDKIVNFLKETDIVNTLNMINSKLDKK